MLHRLEDAARTASHAIGLIADRTAAVDPWWVAMGTLLFMVSQVVRTRAWHTVLRAAHPEATTLRARDVTRAYLVGSGINSIVPARGGDVLKLAMVHRRIEGSSYATLAATLLAETLFETVVGVALVGWALSQGFLPIPTTGGELPALDASLLIDHPIVAVVGAVALGALGWLLTRRAGERLRQGLAILRAPRRFLTGVASWQALARVFRLGSLAAFLAAFALPVTPATVVLVMAAQGGGRIVPLAPASIGLRLAMLSYGFVEVTGHPVDIAAVTAFTFGVGALLGLAGLTVAALLLGQEFGTRSPRRALSRARARLGGVAPVRPAGADPGA
jgi:hypothetical protein